MFLKILQGLVFLFVNSVSFVFSSGYGLPGGHQGHGDRNGKW